MLMLLTARPKISNLLDNPFIKKDQERNPFIAKARQYDAEIEELEREPKLEFPDTPEGMLELLSHLSDDELQEMLEAQEELEKRLAEFGPQDDDELHAWIKSELKFTLPRTSVCPNHDPPFKFIADLYFERVDAVLGMANRGGGKTILVAILHWINSLFKHGCESCTFGATEAQSLRCYAYIKSWVYNDKGERRPEVVSSLMRETVFALGSRIEVLPGTPQAVNGPHPQKAHADEIELMDDGTFRESRNMTMSKTLADGTLVRAQDIMTSTRKGPNGRMQKLIDEITFAVNAGYKPPRALYQWCIKETASQVLNCQRANPDIPSEKRCQCHKIRKGEWADGAPRLLSDICNGDFYKSRGWQPFDDVIKQFTENDQETFEVQQLCLKPELRWHYLPKFVDEEPRYCFRNYDADPGNGPIYTSVDWGGTNPHAVNWYQYLQFEIEVEVYTQYALGASRIRLPQGSIIAFDEIYKAEIGNARLGQLVLAKEATYQQKWGRKWRIAERFADPQGKAARKDWRDMGMKTTWHVTREFEEHIKVITDLFEDDRFYVAADKCPMWVREAREWRRNPNTGQQLDVFNHCMSDFRYGVANICQIHKRKVGTFESIPVVDPTERQSQVTISVRRPPPGPLGFSSPGDDEFSRWRDGLGQPISPIRDISH